MLSSFNMSLSIEFPKSVRLQGKIKTGPVQFFNDLIEGLKRKSCRRRHVVWVFLLLTTSLFFFANEATNNGMKVGVTKPGLTQ